MRKFIIYTGLEAIFPEVSVYGMYLAL